MDEIGSNRSKLAETVLLFYAFGALMTLTYYRQLFAWLDDIREFTLETIILLLLMDVFSSSSVTAALCIPVSSVGIGVASAVKISELISGAGTYAAGKRMELIFLLLAIPAHFVIGVYGLSNSYELVRALRDGGKYKPYELALMYAIMLFGMIGAVLFFRSILIT